VQKDLRFPPCRSAAGASSKSFTACFAAGSSSFQLTGVGTKSASRLALGKYTEIVVLNSEFRLQSINTRRREGGDRIRVLPLDVQGASERFG
jgi:hypothetical protein